MGRAVPDPECRFAASGMHAAPDSLSYCSFFDVSDSSGIEGERLGIDDRPLTSTDADGPSQASPVQLRKDTFRS